MCEHFVISSWSSFFRECHKCSVCLYHCWYYATASDGSSVKAGVGISDGVGDVYPGDAGDDDDSNGWW